VVLLVEDEEPVRGVITKYLQRTGFRVLEAQDGASALEILSGSTTQVDLAIVDAIMPGMTGREVAEQIARLRPSTKILYISGYTEDEILRRRALQADIAFLQKPFSPHALIAKVFEVLQGNQDADAAKDRNSREHAA
jgi:two-component system, cell cycle sensor histidine kinase and response regulator CckA